MKESVQSDVELFKAALEIDDAFARKAFLEKACKTDKELQSRVEKMIASHNATIDLIDASSRGPNLPQTVDLPTSVRSGTIIAGKYNLINPVGEGGMGTVWMAEQREPVKRLVALKLIKAGMDSKLVLARFEAERQALALMDHPNIARILDGGITELGSPYFVMELVKGVPITEYCDAKKLTPQQRLELFVPVCQAIQHAHQKGIIHRDIKPSNVIVGLYDDKPVPKVIDFGVAKATGQALTEHTLNTGFSVVGTPQYMSPEQATFNQVDIDTRSDIYSLGVLLYELLAGSPPFQRKELAKAGYLEILRIIREDEPPRPSTKLSTADGLPTLSATRSTEPKKLTGMLRNELDWIVMKALEKDRSRRYETANAFAADVQRYLLGEVVQAHPPSHAYVFQKFLRKNRGPVLATGLIFSTLTAGIFATTLASIDANNQRKIAVSQQKKAEVAEEEALEAYRASTDDAMEQLLGSKEFFGPQEKFYLQSAIDRWKQFSARAGENERNRAIRAEGHYRVGKLMYQLGENEGAKLEIGKALEIQDEITLEFPSNPKYQYQYAQTMRAMCDFFMDGRNYSQVIDNGKRALVVLEKLVSTHPDLVENRLLLFEIKSLVAESHHMLGDVDLAIQEFREQIALIEKSLLSFRDHPLILYSLCKTRGSLVFAMQEKGLSNESFAEQQKVLLDVQYLAQRFPNNRKFLDQLAIANDGMANNCLRRGRTNDAVKYYRASMEIVIGLVDRFPSFPEYLSGLAATKNDLGQTLGMLGKHNEAIAEIEGALSIKHKLEVQHPRDSVYDGGIPIMTTNLIHNLLGAKDFDAAIAKSIENEERLRLLIKQSPDYPHNLRVLASTLFFRATALTSLQRKEEALLALREAMEMEIEVIKGSPLQIFEGFSLSQMEQLFSSIVGKERVEESIKNHEMFIKFRDYQVERFPNDQRTLERRANAYLKFASLLIDRQHPSDGLPYVEKSIQHCKMLLDSFPESKQGVRDLAQGLNLRACANMLLSNSGAANEDWDRALELATPQFQMVIQETRVRSRFKAGKVDEALAEINQLARTAKLCPNTWYNFACYYSLASIASQENKKLFADRAVALFGKAVDAGYSDADHVANDTDFDPIRDRVDFKSKTAKIGARSMTTQGLNKYKANDVQGAIVDYDEAIRLDPKYSAAYINRGIAKDSLKEFQEAINDYDQAIKLDPKSATAFGNRGWANQMLRNYKDAIRDYDEAILLDPKGDNAKNNKAFLLSVSEEANLRDPELALTLVEEVLANDPENVYALNAKSCALAAKGDRNAAIELQRKAMSNAEWAKDEGIDGGIHAQSRISAWESGKLWHP